MKSKRILLAFLCASLAPPAFAQQHDAHQPDGIQHAMAAQTQAISSPQGVTGPHGGSIKQTGKLQMETVVSQRGIQVFAYEQSGQPVTVRDVRGAASLRIEGNAKRYRYDLLPDGKGGLTVPVNLSKVAGRQVEIVIQLFGISGVGRSGVQLKEVATVPVSEAQLAAAAIARQKICPVSGKPLGSMGDPLAVEVGSGRVFVCCAGCVNAVKANPEKYLSGRPEIAVTSAAKADATLIAAQKTCPVMDEPLGSMGQPIKVIVGDKPIFLCCRGCIKKIQAEPTKYLAKVYGKSRSDSVPAGTDAVRAGVFKVTADDQPFITAQKKCPVMDEPLDAMGGPFKVHAAGKAIYICCPGCAKRIAAEPEKYLDILASQGVTAPLLR
jgi:YHS domain-containing protein